MRGPKLGARGAVAALGWAHRPAVGRGQQKPQEDSELQEAGVEARRPVMGSSDTAWGTRGCKEGGQIRGGFCSSSATSYWWIRCGGPFLAVVQRL